MCAAQPTSSSSAWLVVAVAPEVQAVALFVTAPAVLSSTEACASQPDAESK